MRRGVVALLVLASFGFLPVARSQSVTIPPSQESTSSSHVNGTVRKVVVDSNGGDVTIKPGNGATVKHTDHWVYDKPTVTTKLEDGVLTVTSRCSNAPLNNCWTEVTASVPRMAGVQVNSSLGFVHINGMRTDDVSAATSLGEVAITDVQAKTVKAGTSNSDVRVNLSTAPDDTTLRTTNGNITALVPRGTYALALKSSNGNIRVVNGVRNSHTAAHKLSARTSNADITISGR
jgi:hypothetical protein